MILLRRAISGFTLALSALLASCATGSTLRSGVGDAELAHPPWYAGARVSADSTRPAHVPVAWQRGAVQAPMFEPSSAPSAPVAALLQEMNDYLATLAVTVPVRIIADSSARLTPPDVRFGCETTALDCEASGDTVLGRSTMRMKLAVGRPSESWVMAAGAAADAAGATRLLVLTLEIGQYWTRQSGLRGDKSVELGTGYAVSLPWLTSLETPVQVLQITGALMDRNGRAIRIGAEGLYARRTSLPVSALGAQALISDADVEQLRGLRRDDLAGRPLVWQAALRHLVAELTGNDELRPR